MKDNLTSHRATEYDNGVYSTIPFYAQFHSETIELIKVLKPKVNKWLDTGCGTGNLIEKSIKEFPDCKFYLTDPSTEMMQICKSKFKNNNINYLGNIASIELPTDIYPEIITSIQSHHYMDYESRVKTTRHCYNILNPNGLYITFENIRPRTLKGIETGLKKWGRFQQSKGKSKEAADKHLDRFDKSYFPIRINEHIKILEEAGFKTVELFWMSNMQAGFYGIK